MSREDIKLGLDWETLEYAPRPTRPLSNYFSILDIKFRVWLWRFMPPHPSLSLTWIFSLFLSPVFLFLLLKSWKLDTNVGLAGVCLYLLSPGLLSLVVVLFRPGKAMANFFIIFCLYLASRLTSGEGGKISFMKYLGFLAIVFISSFWDETALLIYPAVGLFFYPLFTDKKRLVLFLSLPFLVLSFYLYLIPALTLQAGHALPNLLHYKDVPRFGIDHWLAVIKIVPVHLRLFILDSLGLPTVSRHGLLFERILNLSDIAVLLALMAYWAHSFFNKTKKDQPVPQSGKELGIWIAFLTMLILLHSFLMMGVNFFPCGLYYYGAYWLIFFVIFLTRLLGGLSISRFVFFVCLGIVLMNQIVCFQSMNKLYKNFHFYPYSPLAIPKILSGEIRRFEAMLGLPFQGRELKKNVLDFWAWKRRGEQGPCPIRFFPKENYWVAIELDPGHYRFDRKQCAKDWDVITYPVH